MPDVSRKGSFGAQQGNSQLQYVAQLKILRQLAEGGAAACALEVSAGLVR